MVTKCKTLSDLQSFSHLSCLLQAAAALVLSSYHSFLLFLQKYPLKDLCASCVSDCLEILALVTIDLTA